VVRLAAALAALAAVGSVLAAVAGAAPKATVCNVKSLYKKPGYPQYVTALTVQGGVPCATGVKLIKAYYACRVRSGGPFAGRCHQPVLGYTCREQRDGISFVYNATVTCRRGPVTVVHHYTQNR
jgi:hypothetical protein